MVGQEDEKRKDRRATVYHVHTEGGAFVAGDVHTAGGDFVGRDKVAGEAPAGEEGTEGSILPELAARIRDSHAVIAAYERIVQTSGRPEEVLRARREIEAQWAHIARWLEEARRASGGALPPDLAEIAAHFE